MSMSEHLSESLRGSSSDLRLILFGNIGCGKTSSADTILGQLSPISGDPSQSYKMRHGLSEGRSITLVEAPRWYWEGCKLDDSVRKETEQAMALVAPGPHAVLLLVPVNQFTEMEGRVPAELKELFGKEVLDHTLVLLTCGDYLMGRTVEEYLQKEHSGMRQMIECCGGRYHVLNNRQQLDRAQVQELLKKVENMVQKNGAFYGKTAQEKELERRVKERKQELMESFRAQKKEEKKTVSPKNFSNTDPLNREKESLGILKRRTMREDKDQLEGRIPETRLSNGLNSAPALEQQARSESRDDRQFNRTPSFRLNADGALLSQISEVKSTPKVISTFHHRINSFDDETPETSPISPSSFQPSETFAASPSLMSMSQSSMSLSSISPSSISQPSMSPSSVSSSSMSQSSMSQSSMFQSPMSPSSISQPSMSPSSVSQSSMSQSSMFQSPMSPSSISQPSMSPSFMSQSSSSFSSSSPELRLVLLGRSGAGKSAAGNRILGQDAFESHSDSFTAVTQKCEKKKAVVEGRRVAVVDTPDWFKSEQTPDEVRAQISSCVALSSPGPHAFLLCVPVDQTAKIELQSLTALETVFGPESVQKYTMVLFTYADRLRATGKAGDKSVKEYIASQRGDLLKLVEHCGDRFHVLGKEKKNVAELLEKVEQTVREAGGQCYSSPAFQEAEKRVRQKQLEIAQDRGDLKSKYETAEDGRWLSTDRQRLPQIQEDEIDGIRDEAEMSVSEMNIESLPAITLSTMSPSLLSSVMEKMQSSAKYLPKLLADSSVWVGEGAKKMKDSPVWGTVGSGAQNVQKMVVDSSMWEKMGSTMEQVSKAVGGRVPKVVVDGSSLVGTRAKAVAASPVWEKVGSGAKLVANGSVRVGAGIGTGAKNLAQSPVWSKVGSGAMTGAKLVADSSVRVGSGISAGAKRVAQSPVWEKVGTEAKARAKMVADSSVWEKIGTTAKQIPKVVIVGAILGLVLGVILGGVIGGAVGTAAGSATAEVGRRKFSNKNTERNVERTVNNSIDAAIKEGKSLKTD